MPRFSSLLYLYSQGCSLKLGLFHRHVLPLSAYEGSLGAPALVAVPSRGMSVASFLPTARGAINRLHAGAGLDPHAASGRHLAYIYSQAFFLKLARPQARVHRLSAYEGVSAAGRRSQSRDQPVVVASFRPTARPPSLASDGCPSRSHATSPGKDTGIAAPGPNTAPILVGFWASHSLAPSPDRPWPAQGFTLTFGAARLRVLPHTASRRLAGLSRAPPPACSSLRLAAASNLLRRGLGWPRPYA